MDKKTKIICDFLVDKEGFYIEQYKSGYEEKLVWIKRFQRGLYTVIITDSVHAVEDEADVIRYLQEKNMPYSLQIVIFTDGKYEPINIRSKKIIIDKRNNKLLYSDEEVASLAQVFVKLIDPKLKKQKIKDMNITISLIAINIIVYIISALMSGNIIDIDSMTLFKMGAKYGPAIENGQVWRLFTAAFLHADIMHIAFNMYSLYITGADVEKIYGKKKYIIMYVLSAIGSSLLSFILAPRTLAVGASGAIFGLLGALLVYTLKNRKIISRNYVFNISSVILLNLYIGFTSTGIDNYGHIGGLIVGIIVSLILNIL